MTHLFHRGSFSPGRALILLLAAIILTLNTANARNQANTQDQKIDFSARSMDVAQAIRTIEQQTGCVFSYTSDLLDVRAGVSFSQNELTLEEALKQMLVGKGLNYMLRNKYIIIHPDLSRPTQQPAEEIRAPRTGDLYARTPADSIGASPLKRPVQAMETAAAETGRKTEVSPPAYSSYQALDKYTQNQGVLPSLAVKTNLLYAGGTLTPNLMLEIGTGPKTSFQLSGSYNPWNRVGTTDDNEKWVHWVVRPEFRWWFCERFNGHFLSANLFYNQYNISGKNIPFVNFKKEYRYEGNAWGAGINYGYQLPLSKRWGLEFSAGVGVARMKYDLFECSLCSGVLENKTKTYFGPTHASVSLVFMIR